MVFAAVYRGCRKKESWGTVKRGSRLSNEFLFSLAFCNPVIMAAVI